MKKVGVTILGFAALSLFGQAALAGPFDPDCTAEKAARSAATKATVGVGGRCSPAEAAKDSAKRAVEDEDGGPIDNRRDDDDHDDDHGDDDDYARPQETPKE